MIFLFEITAILRKDLLREIRSKEIIVSMLLFSLLMVLVFSFAFVFDGQSSPHIASGIIWVSLTFAGTLGISRSFDRERESSGMKIMLLSPAHRNSIYLAKVIGIFLFLGLTALLIVPLISLLFHIDLGQHPARIVWILFLGMLGFSLLGAFLGAMMSQGKGRDLLFSIALYPLLFPLLIASIMACTEVFSGNPNIERLNLFVSILISFNVIIGLMALWTFERLLLE